MPSVSTHTNLAPALPRLRLALYGVAALGALALWLLAPSLLPKASTPAPVGTSPIVDVTALDAIDNDLGAWSKLLADPRLEELQQTSQLQPGQPGNPSPFVREVAPAQ
jgi:hypothetical protein